MSCTLWPDRWGSYDLGAACLLHDEDYAARAGYLASNWRLYENVRMAGNPLLAGVMLVGTTIFGWPWYLAARIKKYLRGVKWVSKLLTL